MKFVDEYRNADAVKILSEKIHSISTGKWAIMEICGGQTHTIMRYGLEELLPENITILHGPGCPVCVTPVETVDKAISLSFMKDTVLASYGDMLRVPGSKKDLQYAKAEGADVRIVYSALDALRIAEKERDKKIIFFAIGFETTAPANGSTVLYAKNKNLNNFFLLSSHMIILPAVEMILSYPGSAVQGLLAPGHVCTVTGYKGFTELSERYNIPVAVTGFEPVDILQGILFVLEMLETSSCTVKNQYSRSVRPMGNPHSLKVIEEVFETAESNWRGIGIIPNSGLKLRKKYAEFDAEKVFDTGKLNMGKTNSEKICPEKINTKEMNLEKIKSKEKSAGEATVCIAGEILMGLKKPIECNCFGKECTPISPIGAPMVSSEGACAAYYKYSKRITRE